MSAQNGGEIRVPQLTVASVGLSRDAASVLDLAALKTLPGGSLTVAGVAVALPGLVEADGASFYVTGGGALRLPGLVSYRMSGGDSFWQVSGAGSTLVLPGLTNVVAGGPNSWQYFHVEALEGGQVVLNGLANLGGRVAVKANGTNSVVYLAALREISSGASVDLDALDGGRLSLNSVTQISNPGVSILSDGLGSFVDLPALVRFEKGTMEVRNQGENLAPRLFFLEGVALVVRNGGRITTSQIRRMLNGKLTIDATTVVFRDLYNWIGTTFDYVNGGRVEFPPKLDLTLAKLKPDTDRAWAGEPFTVSWTDSNASTNDILGGWTDRIYLSADERWDVEDILLGSTTHTNGLAAGQSCTNSIAVVAPGVLPGDYYVIVRGDFFDQVNEMSVETNNLATYGPMLVDVHLLPADGTPVSGTCFDTQLARYYAVTVLPGMGLHLNLKGTVPGQAAGLYASFDRIPTSQTRDAASLNEGTDQRITLTDTRGGGLYYVLVLGKSTEGTNQWELHAETKSLIVTGVTPGRLGNAVDAVVGLTGAAFDETTSVEFVDAGGRVRLPIAIVFTNPDEPLSLSLDVTGWLAGSYGLRVTKGTNVVELPNALYIVQGGMPKLQTRLILPSSLGIRVAVRQTIWLEYTNAGNVAMPAPLLTLRADYPVRLTADPALAIPRPTLGDLPGVSDTVKVLGVGSSVTPWLLQPGESGRIPVYYIGFAELVGEPVVTFTLTPTTFDDTSPIPWSGMESSIRPGGLTDEQWLALRGNLESLIGNRWGDYARLLSESMAYLHQVGQSVTDLRKLWRFLLLRASGALVPITTLDSSVDAATPVPGSQLVFQRVYHQGMLSRYRKGPLGRGWSHNWEMSVEIHTNFQAVVRAPAGADRWFTQNADGVYVPSPGDYGSLVFTNGAFRLTEPEQTFWQFRSNGLLDFVEDSNGNRTTLAYAGRLVTSVSHSCGKQFQLSYDGQGRLLQLTDPVGSGTEDDRVTTYEYDTLGEHLVTVSHPGERTTLYRYRSLNGRSQEHALGSVTYPDNRALCFEYDGVGRLARVSYNCGQENATRLALSYEGLGQVTVSDPTGRSQVLSFGVDGRIVQTRDGEGRVTRLGYDENGDLTALSLPGDRRYTYERGVLGTISAVTDPLHYVTRFSYGTPFNRLRDITDARTNSLRYVYDDRGNRAATVYADGSRESFSYDAAGSLISYTNRRGQVIQYSRNGFGQVTSVDYLTTPGVDYRYDYDANGYLVCAIDSNGTNTMTYDSATGWLTRIEYPGRIWFTFDYDALGRRIRRTGHDGYVLGYIYDRQGRLDQMTNAAGMSIVDYDYDAGGRLIRKTLGSGVFTTYKHNAAGQIVCLVNCRPDKSVLSCYQYAYDSEGHTVNVHAQRGYDGLPVDEVLSVAYDPLGQLVCVQYSNGRVVSYEYDAVGNRTVVRDKSVSEIYTANALNQYVSVGDTQFLHDADGNITNESRNGTNRILAYDPQNRLTRVIDGTSSVTFTYDAFGNRASIENGNGTSKRYITDPFNMGNIVAEYNGGDNLEARYDYGVGLVRMVDGLGASADYTFTPIGSTSEVVNNGAVVNAYGYDAWGVLSGRVESVPNPFTFIGELGVFQDQCSVYFMRTRHYDSALGRFTQVDPVRLRGGINLYAYVRNSPVNAVDPVGLFNVSNAAFGAGLSMMSGTSLWPWGVIGGAAAGLEPSDVTWLNDGAQQVFDSAAVVVDGFNSAAQDVFNAAANQASHDIDRVNNVAQGIFDQINGIIDSVQDLSPGGSNPGPVGGDGAGPDGGSAAAGGAGGSVNGVGTFDPNDKVGPAGYGSSHFVQFRGSLFYQVRFENMSRATAPAREIVVTDVLDPNLDLDTFQLVEIGFAEHLLTLPAGLDSYEDLIESDALGSPIMVEVHASLDPQSRRFELLLRALDPVTGWYPEDPLIGLLYPEDGTGRGQGYVSYLVSPP
ncbi:MAG TPA: RHS repeat-associated core domain-containing protein, partial [Candidatus Paceibacterota bacterium]|nr:RHS repeat-associated core domain-containing protein [Candidatus Paceibacterota bacterium]